MRRTAGRTRNTPRTLVATDRRARLQRGAALSASHRSGEPVSTWPPRRKDPSDQESQRGCAYVSVSELSIGMRRAGVPLPWDPSPAGAGALRGHDSHGTRFLPPRTLNDERSDTNCSTRWGKAVGNWPGLGRDPPRTGVLSLPRHQPVELATTPITRADRTDVRRRPDPRDFPITCHADA